MEVQNKQHLRNPEEVEVCGEKFILYSIPAMPAQDILLGAFDAFKNGAFSMLGVNVTYKMLAYVEHNGILLEAPPLVDAHVKDAETLLTLQILMGKKNFSFLQEERFQKHMETLNKIVKD